KGREGIVGDLRTGRRYNGEQRRLPRVRLADEPNIGDQLELHFNRAGFALFARLPLAWRLVRRSGEERITLPAPATLRNHRLLPIVQDLGDDLARILVAKNRPRRHRHDYIGAGTAALVGAHSVLATLGDPAIP